MADSDLRDLERRYRETHDPADHARLLQERLRAGLLQSPALELASRLGSPGAQLAAWGTRLPDLGPILEDLSGLERQVQDAVAEQRFEHAASLRNLSDALRESWASRWVLPRPVGGWALSLADEFPQAAQRIGLALSRWYFAERETRAPALRRLERKVLERGAYGALEDEAGVVDALARLIRSFDEGPLGALAYRAVADEVAPWALGEEVVGSGGSGLAPE